MRDDASFVDVARRVSAREDAELLPPADIELLDTNRAEEVEPITIEREPVHLHDEDALREYDRENPPS